MQSRQRREMYGPGGPRAGRDGGFRRSTERTGSITMSLGCRDSHVNAVSRILGETLTGRGTACGCRLFSLLCQRTDYSYRTTLLPFIIGLSDDRELLEPGPVTKAVLALAATGRPDATPIMLSVPGLREPGRAATANNYVAVRGSVTRPAVPPRQARTETESRYSQHRCPPALASPGGSAP